MNRRHMLALAAGSAAAAVLCRPVHAQEAMPASASPGPAPGAMRHGISVFGDLAYPSDFTHLAYVNPDAPKGGTFSQIGPSKQFNQSFLTFNTLNSFVLKGDAPQGMELTFASLMARAADEPDAMYAFAARGVTIEDDGRSYRFHMRPQARFHDGTALTADDAAYSLTVLKAEGHPHITQPLRDMESAEAIDAATLLVRFKPERARDVPLFVAGLPIFSRAFYARQKFDESSMTVPLGSGAYKVGRFEPGRYIAYERVADWWGADLPIMRGQNNFDTVRFEYYRDRDVGFEGFTAKNYLFREEFTSRTWATRYDFPAMRDGRVKRTVIPDDTPSGAQGWFINTRREQFRHPKLREALICAFDFEWANKTLMYDSYQRTHSVFQNSDLMANGKPDADEIALLEPFRGQVSEEVFGEPFVPPVSDGSGQDRRLLRRASELLGQAGFPVKDARRVDAAGRPLTIEFLIDEPTFEPHHMLYIKNLKLLGIAASLRLVDPPQYRARVDSWDFDLIVERFGFSTTPGDALRGYFSSQAAMVRGSQNRAGIADPVIDALIEKVIAAPTRPQLVSACRALDRVIRAGRYWVPHWYKASHWIAYWDEFAFPAQKPRYARGIPETWWHAPGGAAKADSAR